jgi:gamma-glutamylputrescine oxidase
MSYKVQNTSWWENDQLLHSFDFLIVGGGFVGRYTALLLAEKYPKANIGIIDRSPFGAGASTRNAGFATFGNVTEIIDDLRTMSYEEVGTLVGDRFKGLKWIQERFQQAAFDYLPSGGWELFYTGLEAERAYDQLEPVQKLMKEATGLSDVFQTQNTASLGFVCAQKGIYNPYEGQLHPVKLLGLIDASLREKKVKQMGGLQALSINKGEVATQEGYTLSSKQVIVCTNAFVPQLLPQMTQQIVPARGQILVTAPLKKPIPQGIYHSDDGYIYFRSLGDRVLLGGGRNLFRQAETSYLIEQNQSVLDYLRDYLYKVITPQETPAIASAWSGIMAMGTGKFPLIERVDDHTLLCARMGGIGVALSPIAAQKVVDLL